MKANHPHPSRFPRSRLLAVRLEQSLLLGHDKMVDWLLDKGGDGLARKGHQLPPLLAAIRPAGPSKTDEIRQRMVNRLLDISPREAANSIESRTMIGILEENCQTALRKQGARIPPSNR